MFERPPGEPGPAEPVLPRGARWVDRRILYRRRRSAEAVIVLACLAAVVGLAMLLVPLQSALDSGEPIPTSWTFIVGPILAVLSLGLVSRRLRAYAAWVLPRACVGGSSRLDTDGSTPGPTYLTFRGPQFVQAWFDKALGLATQSRWGVDAARGARTVQLQNGLVALAWILAFAFVVILQTMAAKDGFALDLRIVPVLVPGLVLAQAVCLRIAGGLWGRWYRTMFLEAPGQAHPSLGAAPSYSNLSTSTPRARSPVNK